MKRLLVTTIVLLVIFTTVSYADDREENADENINQENYINTSTSIQEKPVVNSRKYTIYDRKSGLSIYGKNENKQTAMASTTKIMTRHYCT